MPNMSVASPQVIQASSMLEENKPQPAVSTVVATNVPPTKVVTQEPATQTTNEASAVAEKVKSSTTEVG
jgi:hypothetical protein